MPNMGLLGLLNQIPQGGGLLDIASQFPGYTLPWLRNLPQQTPPFMPPQGNFWQGNQFMMPNIGQPVPGAPAFMPPPPVEGTAAFVPPPGSLQPVAPAPSARRGLWAQERARNRPLVGDQ